MITTKKVKTEIKERLSSKNISDKWVKVKRISETVAIVGGLLLAAPITLPVIVTTWVSYIVMLAATVGGRAHLDKSKKINN